MDKQGHFEKGKWIEDEPKRMCADRPDMQMEALVRVHVDDSELRALKETLDSIQHVISPPVTFLGRLRWLLFGGEI